jgi:hypothetical protein
VTIVVTWPFVVNVVVSRSVPPFEPDRDPHARPIPTPIAKRHRVSVKRIATQLRLRRITTDANSASEVRTLGWASVPE